MIDVDLVVAVITISINVWLALVVVAHAPRTASTKLFLGMSACIVLWTFANWTVDEVRSDALALWWMRALYIFAIGFIYLFFLFAARFGEIRAAVLSRLEGVVHGLALAMAAASLTPLVFAHATVGPGGLQGLSFGPLYMPINLCALALVFWSTGGLVQKERAARDALLKDQIRLIILGWLSFLTFVIVFAAILPYFVPAFVSLSKVTPLFSIVMIAATSYSIIRHQFLNIKLVFQRGLVYSILLGCILGMYVGFILGLTYLFSASAGTASLIGGALTTVAGIFSAPTIERYFQKKTDPIFFKDTYEYSAALESLGAILNANVRLPLLAARSADALSRLLRPEFVAFVIGDRAFGPAGALDDSFPPGAGEEGLELPFVAGKREMGTLFIGPKRSGDPYTSQDHALLRTFCTQAAIAFQKAELFERLRRHSALLEKKVASRTRHLEELRERQRQFMDDISHALQTPLTVLKSAIELLPAEPPEAQALHMKTITRSIDDLSRLIRNLLELAAIDAMPPDGAFGPLDLSVLIEGVVEYVQTICQEHAIALSVRVEPGLRMMGDAHQVEEAVTNVLSNAVRYTKDCPAREISVSLARDGDEVQLSISDTGIGIRKEQLPYIFERFYRAQQEQGAGLGLAITRRIMERHHGRIEVESVYGMGTTMTLRFPALPDSSPTRATTSAVRKSVTRARTGRSRSRRA